MEKYTVIYEIRSGMWYAHVPALPGCVAVGETLAQAEQRIYHEISLYFTRR